MFIANWKMNGSEAMINDWLMGVALKLDKSLQSKCIFCPPVCYLSSAHNLIKKENLNISLGAQDIDPNDFSSLTGGINASMLTELGSEYVIIGHSERREAFREDESLLLQKINSASEGGLIVIFCIGESLIEKEQHKTLEVLTRQLEVINKSDINQFMIAYEPIWAIGSGKTPKLKDITNIHKIIIDQVKSYSKAGFLGISYGGSIDSLNSSKIISLGEVNGLLIGGSSLKYKEFSKIVLNQAKIQE